MQRVRTSALLAALMAAALASVAAAQDDVPEVDFGAVIIQDFDGRFKTVELPGAEELQHVQIDSTVRLLVEQLDDESYSVREQATTKLSQTVPDRLQLYALLLPDSGLSTEQRYRVLTVLRESLVKTPRGAIGVRMNPLMRNIGAPIEVRVGELLPGLPAEKVLKVGDRITHVDDQPLRAQDDLTFRVQSKKPGDKVKLIVQRPPVDAEGRPNLDPAAEPETLHVELELAPVELLDKFNAQQFPGLVQQPIVMPSRVEMARLEEAKHAAARLAPEPRRLPISGESRLIAGAPDATLIDSEVDAHPWVQQLLVAKRRLAEGQIPAEDLRVLRDQWQLQYVELNRMLYNRNNTQERQEYLIRVRERFGALMLDLE